MVDLSGRTSNSATACLVTVTDHMPPFINQLRPQVDFVRSAVKAKINCLCTVHFVTYSIARGTTEQDFNYFPADVSLVKVAWLASIIRDTWLSQLEMLCYAMQIHMSNIQQYSLAIKYWGKRPAMVLNYYAEVQYKKLEESTEAAE